MFNQRYRWGVALGVAGVLAFTSAGIAQQSPTEKTQTDKKTKVTKPVQKTEKTQKASPEVEKARAEVKALHKQMTKLRKEMHATREKMHKAWANLAKLEGRDTTGFAHHRGWRHHHRMGFAHWRGHHGWHAHGMRGRWGHHWARFHDGEMMHHGGAAGAGDINARLEHLQLEIDALRRQVQTQGNPQHDR